MGVEKRSSKETLDRKQKKKVIDLKQDKNDISKQLKKDKTISEDEDMNGNNDLEDDEDEMDENEIDDNEMEENNEIEEGESDNNDKIEEDREEIEAEENEIENEIEDGIEEDLKEAEEKKENREDEEIKLRLKSKLIEAENIFMNSKFNNIENSINNLKKGILNAKEKSRLENIENKVIKAFNKNLNALYTLCPAYHTSAKIITEETILEAEKNVGLDYNSEIIASRMYQPIALANSKLHRSVLKLNEDKTVMGTLDMEKIQDLEQQNIQQSFQSFYMENITQDFEQDLEKIREEEDFTNTKLQFLIDALQHGSSIFSDFDKELMLSTEKDKK